MGRNWLKGEEGDRVNILMASCGFNMKKLLRVFLCFALRSLRMSKKLCGLNCFTNLSAVAA
jgi:IS5 family transposase